MQIDNDSILLYKFVIIILSIKIWLLIIRGHG